MPDVTLATYALTSLERVKQVAKISGDDPVLDDSARFYINVASSMVMRYAGHEFKALATNPSTRTFVVQSGGYVSLTPYSLQPAGAGLAISTLTGAGTGLVTTALTADDYLFGYGTTVNEFNLTTSPTVPTRVSITGTWGWLTVPDEVEYATVRTVVYWLKGSFIQPQEFPDDTPVFTPTLGLPAGVRAILDMFRVPVVA